MLPVISVSTTNILVGLYEDESPVFYDHVEALVSAGWPLRAIAEPLGVSGTTVSVWAGKATHSEDISLLEDLPSDLPRAINSRYRKSEVSEESGVLLRSLVESARRVRRNTPDNSPFRVASAQLDSLLSELNASGVSIERLATECGVSRGAIVRRLNKA